VSSTLPSYAQSDAALYAAKHAKPAEQATGLLVAFKSNSRESTRVAAVQSLGLQLDARNSNRFVARFTLAQGPMRRGRSLAEAMSRLSRNPSVRIVEPDYPVHAFQTAPNDPFYSRLWGMNNAGQTGGVANADINAPEAWLRTTGSANVVVAVIDSGVDWTHPDLAANIWTNSREIPGNGLDDDRNGYVDDVRGWDFANNDNNPMDDHGHGTHCSGTIGAVGGNGIGVVGVCPTVRIMPLKFLTNTGGGATSNAILAIDYARVNGAQIMSNSWGGSGASQLLLESIQRARDAGILFLAAAGNNGSNVMTAPNYPAAYNLASANVVSVASTTDRDQLSSFSNFSNVGVEIAAPGSSILSTVPNLADKDGTVDGYTTMSGTSMATPHVAGAAALVKSLYPSATWQQLKTRLLESSDRVPALASTVRYGRLNVNAALENDLVPPDAPTAFAGLRRSTTTAEVQWVNGGDDGISGKATALEMRVSAAPITSANWNQARVVAAPAPGYAGTVQRTSITGLAPGSTIYLALRATDNVGNPSVISAAGPYSMRPARWTHTAESMTGFTPDTGSTWGLASAFKTSGATSVSDSPVGNYKDNANTVVNINDPVVVGDGVAVTFMARQMMEMNYDFSYLEASSDNGATWRSVWAGTGNFDWTPISASLGSFAGQTVRLRFRLQSDSSVNSDGFYVDDLAIVPQQRVAFDNFEGAFNWSATAPWAKTTAGAYSGANSLSDSPTGTYASSSTIAVTMNSPVTFGALLNPQLQFVAKTDLERGFDFMDILVAPSGSTNFQAIGAVTGTGPWQGFAVPLPTTEPMQLRFALRTDSSINGDGIFMDDMSFVGEPAEVFGTTINGQLAVPGYLGNLNGRVIEIDVRRDGSTVETRSVTLDAQGKFTFTTSQSGSLALSAKYQGYLRRTLAVGTTLTMTPGDVDGDNSVTVRDYSRLAAAYNTTPGNPKWDAAADVDGNGSVGYNDYLLVIRNYNRRGDK